MDYAQLNKQLEVITNNFNNLSTNMVSVGGTIKNSVLQLKESTEKSSSELTKVLDDLNLQIKNFSDSNDRQAGAMKWMTFFLVILTLALVVGGIITILKM